MRGFHKISLIFIFWWFGIIAYGQSNFLDTGIELETQNGSVQSILDDIEINYNIIFSFDPNRVLVQQNVNLNKKHFILSNLLDQLFIGQSLQYKSIRNKILILPVELEYIELSGYIYNEDTGEILSSALVHDNIREQSTYTDEQGYYRIKLLKGQIDIAVYYLGNVRVSHQSILEKDKEHDFFLPTDYNLDSVIIISKGDPFTNVNNTGEKIIDYIRNTYKGKFGQKEVFEDVRMLSGVQSGGEAQGGYYMRGGTPDQNLILMDGIPMYETSHLGGLSSIFIDDMIRDIELIKSGFPARYGGRLSSILDIKLKDGNWKKTNTIFDIGFDAVHFHMDGPLSKEKLSFNFSLRKSILNKTISPLFAKLRSYDDLELEYLDLNFKITYKINPKHKLSLTAYIGNDKIGIYKDSTNTDIVDHSRIGWGTSLIGLNYQYKISNKWFFQAYANTLKYERYARGNYTYKSQDTIPKIRELDVLVYSGITDQNYKFELDYHITKNHILRHGINLTKHRYNPIINKSENIINGEYSDIVKKDSSFQSSEYYVYLEDNINFRNFDIYAGLHWSNYNIDSTYYQSLQPRISIKWHPLKQLTLSTSASKMQQNIHFLLNPGLGLPSELWIPSTSKLAPQEIVQYGLGATYHSESLWRIGIDYYIKNYTNVLEYDNPNDLFYAFILNNTHVDFSGNIDWQGHIESGKSKVHSFEIFLFKKWEKIDFWMSYNWSKHLKTFEKLNNGIPFYSKHDRRHDINIKASYKLTKNWSTSASWIFGSGNRYTLPLEQYKLLDSLGISTVPGVRNDWQISAFHHLDISAQYKRVFEHFALILNMGVYNIYNHLNPFYIYLHEDRKTGKIKLRQISLYPVVPFLNIRVKF